MNSDENYWKDRYDTGRTGWDIGSISTPLKAYFDQLKDRSLRILIPGAGNAYEARYLWENGFKNVFILDIVQDVITSFIQDNPSFPSDQAIHEDFFQHEGQYDLIIEQTFFCSFPPLKNTRAAYAKKMSQLLGQNGQLVGLWFTFPLTGDMEKRPFGGTQEEYLSYFEAHFSSCHMEPCYNSIPPRQGNELWGRFRK